MKMRASSAILASLLALSLSGCGDPRADIDAVHVVETFEQAGIPITGMRDDSANACAYEIPCRQSVVTDQVTVWRFASREDAASYAKHIGAHQSDFIVLDFAPGALTPTQRDDAASMVDSMHVSD